MEGISIYLQVKRRNSNGLCIWSQTQPVCCSMWGAPVMCAVAGVEQRQLAWAGIRPIQASTNISVMGVPPTKTLEM